MKKILTYLLAASAAAGLVACGESLSGDIEPTPALPVTEPVYLTASIQSDAPAAATAADTRVGADDDGTSVIKLTWQEGDVLHIVNSLAGSSTAYRFTAVRIEDGGKTAVFESPAGYTGTPAMAMWLGDWNGTAYDARRIYPSTAVSTADDFTKYCWLYAKYKEGKTNFVFQPLLPLMRLDLTLPAGETAITSLRLQVQDGTAALSISPEFNLAGEKPVVTYPRLLSAQFFDGLNIPLTANHAVLYLSLGESAALAGKKLEIIVNKKYYTTQTCGTLAVGKVASIRKAAAKWTDAVYSGGFGTQASPYLISNETNMRALAASANSGNPYTNQYFKVENDFSISAPESNPWVPIGEAASISTTFNGHIDGDGKTIDGGTFHILPSALFAGLFGNCSTSISNLTFRADIVFNTTSNSPMLGGIVCAMSKAESTLMNCHHIGTIQASQTKEILSCIGGIVCRADGLTDNCSHTGNITTEKIHYLGGICGLLQTTGKVHRCTVSNSILSTNFPNKTITLGALVGGSTGGIVYDCSTYTDVRLIKNGTEIPLVAMGNGSVTPCDQGH